MKINSINQIKINTDKQKQKSFKKGLTSYEINKVNRMGRYEYENIVSRIRSKYGIDADVGRSNTVAFCLESVCEIMDRAGFKLPKRFKFAPLSDSTLGSYNTSDTVIINSNFCEFQDLELQNKLEEDQRSFHPNTRNFLQTYLHEFSHAAHYHNIEAQHGSHNAFDIFWSKLNDYEPNEVIIGPVSSYIKSIYPKIFEKLMDIIIPPEIGFYSMKDLSEYFAEKNSYSLSEQLGESFFISNITPNFASTYKGFPSSWDIDKQIEELKGHKFVRKMSSLSSLFVPGSSLLIKCYINSKIAAIFIDDIEYLDGEIWNGNIDRLKEKSVLMKNIGYR